jgi:hypothetical protein
MTEKILPVVAPGRVRYVCTVCGHDVDPHDFLPSCEFCKMANSVSRPSTTATEIGERQAVISYLMGAAANVEKGMRLIGMRGTQFNADAAELEKMLCKRAIIALRQTAKGIYDGCHVDNLLIPEFDAEEKWGLPYGQE